MELHHPCLSQWLFYFGRHSVSLTLGFQQAVLAFAGGSYLICATIPCFQECQLRIVFVIGSPTFFISAMLMMWWITCLSPIGEAVSLVDSGPFPLALPGQSHLSGANPEHTVPDPARGYITTPSSPLPARFRLAFGHS